MNVTYSNINVFSLIASEVTTAYFANNVFYSGLRPYIFSQGLLLLKLENNTFVNQNSRAPIDCLMCLYLEVDGMLFTNYTSTTDALFDIVTIPQVPVALIFNNVRLENNAFVLNDFRFFMTLTQADTIVFTQLTIAQNSTK